MRYVRPDLSDDVPFEEKMSFGLQLLRAVCGLCMGILNIVLIACVLLERAAALDFGLKYGVFLTLVALCELYLSTYLPYADKRMSHAYFGMVAGTGMGALLLWQGFPILSLFASLAVVVLWLRLMWDCRDLLR